MKTRTANPATSTDYELCGCCDPSCKLWPLSDERIAATERAEAWEAEHGAINQDLEDYANMVFAAYCHEDKACDVRRDRLERKRMAPVELARTRALFARDIWIGIEQVRAKHAQQIAALDN